MPRLSAWRVFASGPRLRPKPAHQLAGAGADVADQHADLLQGGAQLGVADLDRQHRVLQGAQLAVGAGDRVDGALQEALHALAGGAGGGGAERAALQGVALGEAGVGALGAAVGHLHRAEELVLERLGAAFVEVLVGFAERG